MSAYSPTPFDHAGLLAACADAVGRGLCVAGPVRDQHHLHTREFTHDQAGDLLQGPVIISAAVARVSRRAKQSAIASNAGPNTRPQAAWPIVASTATWS